MKPNNSLMDLIASIGLIPAGVGFIVFAANTKAGDPTALLQLLVGAAMIGIGAISCDDRLAGRTSRYPLTYVIAGLGIAIVAAITLLGPAGFTLTTGGVALVGIGGLGFAASGIMRLLAIWRQRSAPEPTPAHSDTPETTPEPPAN